VRLPVSFLPWYRRGKVFHRLFTVYDEIKRDFHLRKNLLLIKLWEGKIEPEPILVQHSLGSFTPSFAFLVNYTGS